MKFIEDFFELRQLMFSSWILIKKEQIQVFT